MAGVMKTLMYNIIIGMFILSIASINVNGLRNNLKRNVIFEFLCRNKFSLIFLQETHSEENDEPVWSKEWQGKMHFSHGNRQSRGVAILTLEKSGLCIDNISRDKEGRWIKGQTKWNNLDIPVASVYAPNNSYDRAYFF